MSVQKIIRRALVKLGRFGVEEKDVGLNFLPRDTSSTSLIVTTTVLVGYPLLIRVLIGIAVQ